LAIPQGTQEIVAGPDRDCAWPDGPADRGHAGLGPRPIYLHLVLAFDSGVCRKLKGPGVTRERTT